MADMVTVQELENAKIDARTIGESVNENKIVTPRYGAPFKSMPMIAEEMQSVIGTIIGGGVPASVVADNSGLSQQQVNDNNESALADRYTKSESDNLLDDKAGLSVVSLKADTFTKSEVSALVSPKADTAYVDAAVGAISTDASKQYATLDLANADIANIALNQNVFVSEAENGGYYYKATAGATSLTKSAYDPLTQAKEYVNIRMILSESKGAFELTDPNGRFVIYIKRDGTIFTKHGDLTVVQSFIKQNQSALLKLLTYDLTNSAMLSQLVNDRSKDYFRITAGDRSVLRILSDASLQVGTLNLTRAIKTLMVDVENLQSNGLQNKWITPNKNLVAVGDSLTAYAHEWFANLNTYLTDKNRAYTNHAVGGDKSTQQALKFGAGNYLLTLENQKIKASGSTNITGTFVRYADKSIVLDTMLSSQSSKTIMGSIAGVKGVINATYSGSTLTALTFTPAVAPSVDVPVYDYTPFIPAALEVDKFKTFAIAIGRNNLSQPERIKQDILAMIDAQATTEKRFFVVTPPSKTYSVSSKDSAEIMANIFDLERWAMENFGDQAIISRQILMRHGDGSATDNLDIANNCVPTSCTEDGLHWTATANTYIAQEVANLINSKGW